MQGREARCEFYNLIDVHMPRLLILLGVLAIAFVCHHTYAQDSPFKINLLFDARDVERPSPSSKETDKTNHDLALSLKATPRVLQQPDMMQYLTDR